MTAQTGRPRRTFAAAVRAIRRGAPAAGLAVAVAVAVVVAGLAGNPGPLGGADASAWAVGAGGVGGCRPGQLALSLDLHSGRSATSPTGAVLLRHTSVERCRLAGVAAVTVTDADGRRLEVLDEPGRTGRPASGGGAPGVTLGRGGTAAVSLTWSDWTCPSGSYELWVRFAGWPHPLGVSSAGRPGASGQGTGSPSCRPGPVVLYVGAPVPVLAPVTDLFGGPPVR